MRSLKVPVVVAAICVVVAVSGSSAWDGFKLPNLNPFSRSTSSQDEGGGGFSLIPSRPAPSAPQRPSRLSTWSRNTRNSISSATRWMNPWAKKPTMPATSPSVSGSRGTTSRRTSEDDEESGNWFTRMFTKEEPEDNRPRTAADFIGQERPRF